MQKYHKIDTLFEREENGNHALIMGKYRNPAVEQAKDLKWVFTEKVDGTNIRIYWDGHKVYMNGRTDNAQLHVDLVTHIQGKFCTEDVEQVFEQKFGEKEVHLFGEGYGAGIQKGGSYSEPKSFILFDVKVGSVYLNREDVEGLAEVFDVPVVPVLLEGTVDEGIEYVRTHKNSVLGDKTHELEGVVGRLKEEMFDRFGNRMIVKLKRRDLCKMESKKQNESNIKHIKSNS